MTSPLGLASETYEEWTGSDGDDVHIVGPNILGRFDGGAGNDTLKINEAGYVRLYDLNITSIETIEGATGDTIFQLGRDVLPKLKHIKGGTGYNTLLFYGDDLDLTDLTLSNIHEITYSMFSAVTPARIVVRDFETAMLVKVSPYNSVYVTLSEGTFSEAQRLALYERGVIYLRDESGDHVNPRPLMNNFHNDRMQTEAGNPGLLDQGAELLFQGSAPYMKSLTVRTTGFHDIFDVYGIRTATDSAVSLSGPMAKGTNILVEGTVIGSVSNLSAAGLEIAFNNNATSARVQEVLRALTYTNTDAFQVSERQIEVIVVDNENRTDRAVVQATVAPNGTQFEMPAEWKGVGRDRVNFFSTREGLQLPFNGIYGGDGDNTLFLSGGGSFNIHDGYLRSVDAVRGSNRDETVMIAPNSMEDVRVIDLRGAIDRRQGHCATERSRLRSQRQIFHERGNHRFCQERYGRWGRLHGNSAPYARAFDSQRPYHFDEWHFQCRRYCPAEG